MSTGRPAYLLWAHGERNSVQEHHHRSRQASQPGAARPATTAGTRSSCRSLEVDEGEQVTLETRDALDGYLNASSTVADFATLPLGAIHPLTGPVFVKGASPGDLLEVEFVDIVPQPWAFSAIMPGLGFLRDVMTEPFLVHWQIADGLATSAQIPGVRIPGGPFMGVSGVAPSRRAGRGMGEARG